MDGILDPIVQFGFAGLAACQLAVIVWMMKRLLDLLSTNQRVIQENTEAIRHVDERTEDLLKISRANERRLLSRPCLRQEAEA